MSERRVEESERRKKIFCTCQCVPEVERDGRERERERVKTGPKCCSSEGCGGEVRVESLKEEKKIAVVD